MKVRKNYKVLVFQSCSWLRLALYFPVNHASLQVKHSKDIFRVINLCCVLHQHNVDLFHISRVYSENTENFSQQGVLILPHVSAKRR